MLWDPDNTQIPRWMKSATSSGKVGIDVASGASLASYAANAGLDQLPIKTRSLSEPDCQRISSLCAKDFTGNELDGSASLRRYIADFQYRFPPEPHAPRSSHGAAVIILWRSAKV